jgi:hypothetical protein
MKKLFILTTTILFLVIYVKAQTADPEQDYIRKTYSKDKKTIVGEYMNLNMQDSVKFWPIYSDYEISREKIAQVRINLITSYVNGYDNLTPEATDKLVKSSFDNNISQDKLNSDYYDKMKKAIGVVQAAKYMQLEIYLQTMWKAVVQSNIPLIGALDKTQHN